MQYQEEVACFVSGTCELVGILARPVQPQPCGVLLLVGGPQYRAGSHRQFVHLARALAVAGYAVLRFDFRGMGDSQGRPADFQHTAGDIGAAINALQQAVPSVSQVALWGLCDGASAALLYCFETHDTRVSALCLANPWVRSEASLARVQVRHYYLQRLLQADFWHRLWRGHIGLAALGELGHQLRAALASPGRATTTTTTTTATATATAKANASASVSASFQQRMAWAFTAFSGRILLLLSEDDYVAKEFLQHAAHDSDWKKALKHPRLVRHTQSGADHTFSSAALRAQVAELTLRHGLSHDPQTSASADARPSPHTEAGWTASAASPPGRQTRPSRHR